MKKKKILCIDIEGGHGGSSRSLFYSISSMVRKDRQFNITVICRKNSWLFQEYSKLGVKCIINENIPRFTPLIKINRNIYQLFLFLTKSWPKSNKFRKNIIGSKKYDIIHFNHISLCFLALWCKYKKISQSSVMHIRTMPPKNIFSRILYFCAENVCNSFIYISENEKLHLHSLIGKPNVYEEIIHNPVAPPSTLKKVYLKNDTRLKIGVLSNFSFNRGVDRALEIFEAIPLRKRYLFVFVLAGDMTLEKNIPNVPEHFYKNNKKFSDFIKTKNYSKNFLFLGQLKEPENLLKSIDILLKPTRLNNPWGRDILEALSFGKPVISIGNYKKFVETRKTGLLLKKYNAKKIAKWLVHKEAHRKYLESYSYEAKNRIKKFCDPNKVSNQLAKVWTKVK